MSTITVNQRAFTEALMLAIIAPDEEKSKKARDLASLIGTSLSEKDKDYLSTQVQNVLSKTTKTSDDIISEINHLISQLNIGDKNA